LDGDFLKKQLIIIGAIIIFLAVGLSGCNEDSNIDNENGDIKDKDSYVFLVEELVDNYKPYLEKNVTVKGYFGYFFSLWGQNYTSAIRDIPLSEGLYPEYLISLRFLFNTTELTEFVSNHTDDLYIVKGKLIEEQVYSVEFGYEMELLLLVSDWEHLDSPEDGDFRLISTEFIGGLYNTSIRHEEIYESTWIIEGFDDDGWVPLDRIAYIKEGVEYIGGYYPQMESAFAWIKTNTRENSTILCWWDYGCAIEGYSERNVIAKAPSISLKDTVAPFIGKSEEFANQYIKERGGWSSNETIGDIANILSTTNISTNEIRELIQKYNISYIFTKGYDKNIIDFILTASGNEDYLEYFYSYYKLYSNETRNNTLVFQMWADDVNIYGLKLVYEDYPDDTLYNSVRIFEVDI
jgi:hypothetical protein